MTNKIHDAFDQINASEEIKSSTMHFLQTQREKRHPHQTCFMWKSAAAAFLVIFVIVLGAGGYYTIKTPISYVSIDVNPSLELALNRYDRVVSATAYNEEGESILNRVKVKGESYQNAIDSLVESEALQPYLTEDSMLTFTVAANDPEKAYTILNAIENCASCQNHQGRGYTADVTSIAKAHEYGMSFGKYKAYLILSEYDNTVTTEECLNMSMAELHHQIQEHKNSSHNNENADFCEHQNSESVHEQERKHEHEQEHEQEQEHEHE
ncbi:MAG: hypothetical protein ACI4TF_03040 [Oliverpabstia sp.]